MAFLFAKRVLASNKNLLLLLLLGSFFKNAFLSSPETAKYLPHLENAIARIVSSILYDEDSEGAFFLLLFGVSTVAECYFVYLLNPFFFSSSITISTPYNTPWQHIHLHWASLDEVYNRYRLDDTSTAVTVRFVVVSILCSVVTFLFLGVVVVVVVVVVVFFFFFFNSSSLFVSDCSQSPPVSFVGLSSNYYLCLSR